MNRSLLTVGLAALGVAACASRETLPPNYVPTEAAISAADAVGAKNEPRAALHLKMARDEVVHAHNLAERGKDHEAAVVLDQARTDAEMALMVTREARARAEATQAERELQGLTPNN